MNTKLKNQKKIVQGIEKNANLPKTKLGKSKRLVAKSQKTNKVTKVAPKPAVALEVANPKPKVRTGKDYICLFGKTYHFRRRQIKRNIDDNLLEKVLSSVSVINTGKMCVAAQASYLQRVGIETESRNIIILLDLGSQRLITTFEKDDVCKYLKAKHKYFTVTVILQ